MYFNRFDIVDAHYWFCADYHEGQWSDLYERLCRISRYYSPSPLANGPATENAREIYDALTHAEYDNDAQRADIEARNGPC